jgi:hypothetical protein
MRPSTSLRRREQHQQRLVLKCGIACSRSHRPTSTEQRALRRLVEHHKTLRTVLQQGSSHSVTAATHAHNRHVTKLGGVATQHVAVHALQLVEAVRFCAA